MRQAFVDDCPVVSDEEMKIIKSKGKKIIVEDQHIKLIGYLYNEKVYIDDIEEIKV